jgi:hypothetical protein
MKLSDRVRALETAERAGADELTIYGGPPDSPYGDTGIDGTIIERQAGETVAAFKRRCRAMAPHQKNWVWCLPGTGR